MIKTLQNTLKQDREGLVLPKSVQDAIPIRRLWPDGIFQFGRKFSKTIRFSDINYACITPLSWQSMVWGPCCVWSMTKAMKIFGLFRCFSPWKQEPSWSGKNTRAVPQRQPNFLPTSRNALGAWQTIRRKH